MIDLHIHTSYSDGTDSVIEILKKAQEKKLDVISITDHNKCLAYEYLKTINIKNYYLGKIIIGCEFTATYNEFLVEVLGYNFNTNKVNKWLKNYYNTEKYKNSDKVICNRILDILDDLKFKYNKNNILKNSTVSIYKEIIKYNENFKKINENIFDNYSDFYRKGLVNSKSKFFVNINEFYPSIKEVIQLIHESGGIAILAHPFQYKIDNNEKFITDILNETNLDGLEAMYTTFSDIQTNYLIELAKKRNILISGGSDYHGNNKQNYFIGIGYGNLNINKNILKNWNIKFYK